MRELIALDKNVAQFHHSEVDRLQRAVTAKNLGLDPEKFAVSFPPNNTTTNITTKSVSGIIPWLIAAVAGTALASAGLIYLSSREKPADKPVDQPPVTSIMPRANSYDSNVNVRIIPPGGEPAPVPTDRN